MEAKYSYFKEYTLRAPLNALKNRDLEGFSLESISADKQFLQGVKLSSPSLYRNFLNWEKNKRSIKKKEEERLLLSILKYYVRSCMRCTPFGLFAGINIGNISKETNIVLDEKKNHKSHTRLDMDFVCNLIRHFEKNAKIREQLIYMPNNSLYQIGGELRYVEYSIEKTGRKYKISSTHINKYLKRVLDIAKNGATINQLSNSLSDDEITFDDAFQFILVLIENQLLISSLYPTVTGKESDELLIDKLSSLQLNGCKDLDALKNIKAKINNTDKSIIGNISKRYDDLINIAKKWNFNYDEKKILQTDLYLKTINNTISSKIIKDIIEGLKVLNKITFPFPQENIQKFKEAFLQKYQGEEVPLPLVLDSEVGISFLQDNMSARHIDNTPLVDDIYLTPRISNNVYQKIKWNSVQRILLNKYVDCLKNSQKVVKITDEDLKGLEENWDGFHDTFSVNSRIIYKDDKPFVFISVAGGTSSAINMISRFSYTDNEVLSLTQKIAKKENCVNNKIVAEVVHLPENRVGNVLFGPNHRSYEIPYLAQSSMEKYYQIDINDLMISVKQNKIVLRSKRLNKEVKPFISNMYNWEANKLPVYKFLAAMQYQNKLPPLRFSWYNIENQFYYFPRVVYKNVILALECWKISFNEIKELLKINDEKTLQFEFSKFINKREIPKHVILADGDNELYINTSNVLYIKMLLSIVKSRNSFLLKEFLFADTNQLVKDKHNNSYANEIVFAFYKKDKNEN